MKALNDEDLELISKAQDVITKNFDFENNNHTVGAAVRCKNGNVYLGVNVYLNHGACAEIIAIGTAITAGEREFDCIVAISGEGDILPPCGNCRQSSASGRSRQDRRKGSSSRAAAAAIHQFGHRPFG